MGEFVNFLDNELDMPFEWQKRMIDRALTSLKGRPVIDIVAFDEYLHSRGGYLKNYEDKGYSMEDVINEIYPSEVARKLRYYLAVD